MERNYALLISNDTGIILVGFQWLFTSYRSIHCQNIAFGGLEDYEAIEENINRNLYSQLLH